MTNQWSTGVFCAFILSLLAGACTPPIKAFTWLEGSWEMPLRKGGVLQENWVRQNGKTLQGRGLKIVARDTTPQESIQLRYSDRGFWYVPTVPDQNEAKPVPFKMVQAADRAYVFENPKHDFPQRISYRFCPSQSAAAPDTLRVRVESIDGKKGMNYVFLRK